MLINTHERVASAPINEDRGMGRIKLSFRPEVAEKNKQGPLSKHQPVRLHLH